MKNGLEQKPIDKLDELFRLLDRSQIFTHINSVTVAFVHNEDVIRFKDILWEIRKRKK